MWHRHERDQQRRREDLDAIHKASVYDIVIVVLILIALLLGLLVILG